MATDSHIIALNGQCLAQVILPDSATTVERFAREELVRYLAVLSAGTGSTEDHFPQAQPPFLEFIRRPMNRPLWYPDIDHFDIQVDDRGVKLMGAGRALLYAVYELLEYWGLHFYFPGEDSVVPETNVVSLPLSYTVSKNAAFPYRAVNLECMVPRDKKLILDHIDWMGKNRFNMLCTHPASYGSDWFSTDIVRFEQCADFLLAELDKRAIALNLNVHTAYFFLPPDTYLAEHPDWYALKERSVSAPPQNHAEKSWCADQENNLALEKNRKLDFVLHNLLLYFQQPIDSVPLMTDNNISAKNRLAGLSVEHGMQIPTQICYSQPEALQTYCDNIRVYLRHHPEVGVLGLWPTDLGGYCQCEKCRSDPQAILKASLFMANELAPEFPDLIVEHLLYQGPSTSMPGDDLIIPGNMLILQACGPQDMINAWMKKCQTDGGLGMYKINYTLADNFQAQGRLCINPRKVVDDFHYLRENGFAGFDVMYIDMYSYWRSCQNLTLLASLNWNPDLDCRKYLSEFCHNYYGKAAKWAEKVYQKMFELDLISLFGKYRNFRLVEFGETSESAYKQNSLLLAECRQVLAEAFEQVKNERAPVRLRPRLKKLQLYLDHLELYSQVGFQRTKVKFFLEQNEITAAVESMREVALKEDQIKQMCLDSYLNGDGVLDYRLTLGLRKFSRFLDYETMSSHLLEILTKLDDKP